MCRIISVILAVGMTLVGAISLFAAGPESKGDRDKVQDRMETLAMWRMIEALDLDQPTANKLLAIRHSFLSQRKSLQRGLSEDFQGLRKQLSDTSKPADEQELTRLLQDIRDKRKELQGLRDQQYDAVSKVLTVRQRAQLVLFFKDFHKEVRSLLRSPQAPGGVPEKGMERPHAGMSLPAKKMGLPPGAAGLSEKAGKSPRLAPGQAEKGMDPGSGPHDPPSRLDEGED
jgi:Spy/CpxP family protein refolding chaperone